ncbi:MAG: 6-phosphofructokinase [Candidatus Cloacimonadota bacterium]|nr:MAG: 6-phosphofructokinase [Candidatus Cloacimonadota bacterium]
MKLKGKVLIAQGGGPTAVINQSLAGAVSEARKYDCVTKVYGALHGVRGIIEEEFIDLTLITDNNLEKTAQTPSSALLSTRDKPDTDYCRKIFKVLKAHDIRYFFYIGGNDSSDTVRIVSEEAKKENYEMRAVHIPKTIDNDLVLNDHTPGFGSAAKFVAQAFQGVNLDNRAIPGVYIGIVMGRHAGFLTAAASMARKFEDDGPHLIYLPERKISQKQFLSDTQKMYDKYGRCIIAVSEGIIDENGELYAKRMVKEMEQDAHGNVQLSGSGALGDYLVGMIKNNLTINRVRCDTFGYLQRSFAGCVSETDQIEAREAGQKAVQFAMSYDKDGSVTINRTSDYGVEYRLAELADIAGKTKLMPDEFINESGNDVTKAFIDYAKPLLGKNFPEAFRLHAPKAEKILNK